MIGAMDFTTDLKRYPLSFPVFYYLVLEKHVEKSRGEIIDKLFGIVQPGLSDSQYHRMTTGSRGISEDLRVLFCGVGVEQIAKRLEELEIHRWVESARTIAGFIDAGILMIDVTTKEELLAVIDDPQSINEDNGMLYMAIVLKAAVRNNERYELTKRDRLILDYYLEVYNQRAQEGSYVEKQYIDRLDSRINANKYERLVMLLVALNYYDESPSRCTPELILSLAENYNVEGIRDCDPSYIEDILILLAYDGFPIYDPPRPLPVYIRSLGSKGSIIARLERENEIEKSLWEQDAAEN